MSIIPRGQANLPPVPASVGFRSLSSWAGIRIHHTGGPFSSWRAVHDWMTAGRPPGERLAYIGYSFGIANGRVTELRGWDRSPAHDFINTHLGVVFGGSYGSTLPPAADLDALVWFIGEAARRGVRTGISTHREVGQTTCPGDRLHRWVKDVLPGRLKPAPPPPEEDDVSWSKWSAAEKKDAAEQIAAAVLAPTAGKGSTLELWPGKAVDLPTWVRRAANEAKKANRSAVENAGVLAGLTTLVEQLAQTAGAELTDLQVQALAAAVVEAGSQAGEQVLARLTAAGEALAGDDSSDA